jgi:hypothetical protein
VPADHSLRRNDDQGLLPSGPDSPRNDLEESVDGAQARSRMAPLQHDKLWA